jgi:[pyruvate, water dikinase]-phosphate phosphotransferase / [pyruvate, water dikinase] kinase
MPTARVPTVLLVSDGRGETAAHLLSAAIVQFRDQPCEVLRRANVRSARRAQAVMREAAELQAVVFYTLVAEETRRAVADLASELLVPTVDLLGPAFSALHDLFKTTPSYQPGLLYATDREKFDRLEAIDFTLKHDDGQRPEDLGEADVVLVGVSRSSKTSTCFYLAYAGVKAANVPLVPEVEPPPQLLRLDRARVVGLRVNAMRLATVREARARGLPRQALAAYLEPEALARELRFANRVMREQGWHCIDVSYMAVEETAHEILRMRGLPGGKRGERRGTAPRPKTQGGSR